MELGPLRDTENKPCLHRMEGEVIVHMTDDRTKMQIDVQPILRTHMPQAIHCFW